MSNLSVLILRVGFGGLMLVAHGWSKLMTYSQYAANFPDPIGLGSEVALMLAIFAELICAGLVVVGLFTRLATIPLMITMMVAAFVIHANDPFMKQEFPLLYLIAFLALFVSGPGKYSVQRFMGLTTSSRGKLASFLLS